MKEGYWNLQSIVSWLEAQVDNLDLELASEMREEGSCIGLSPESVESDAVSGQIVSELR